MADGAEIVIVAAVARNGSIGLGNELVFRDSADQRHFRAVTMGQAVVMGRKTWDSLPPRFRPLPGRRNVVLSRQPAYAAAGAEVAASLDQALQCLHGEPRVYVIGGAQLYAQALPRADALLLTEVDADLSGDACFPDWERSQFEEVERLPQQGKDGLRFDFVHYRRRASAAMPP